MGIESRHATSAGLQGADERRVRLELRLCKTYAALLSRVAELGQRTTLRIMSRTWRTRTEGPKRGVLRTWPASDDGDY